LLQDGPLDAKTVARLMGGFAQELPGRARAIHSALQSRHWRLVSDLAHQLKGSAGLYGFAQVAEAARAVHRQAEEADLEPLEAAVAELVKLCEQT
jgi:HPt (histidine-containing phosphotransfer) domain-containing protein